MSAIDEYLLKARDAIRSGDSGEINRVAKEIVSAFHTEIPHIANYRGMSVNGHGGHTKENLRQLMGKLKVLRDAKDTELYGAYGLVAITDSIRQLEDALLEEMSEEQLTQLYDKIDHIYANTLDAYVDGLCGWQYNDGSPSEDQTKLRIEKLRYYRDEEMRKIKLAESQAGRIAVTQTQTQEAHANATSIAIVDVLEACNQVDNLPEDSLSEADKTFLKGMLLELEMSASKGKDAGKEKLSKVLGFLMDKGVDVLIAAWPFLWTTMQGMMG